MRLKRYIIIIAITILTAVVIFKVHSNEPLLNYRLYSFPNSIGNWIGKDIPMEKWVYRALETPFAIMRNYRTSRGDTVNLAIAWYDDREIAFHAPEACLGGYGNTVKEKNSYILSISPDKKYDIGKLVVERNDKKSLVFYYYINDGFITPNQTKLRAEIVLKRLKLKRTSAAFIRLMMPVNNSQESTQKTLEAFFRDTVDIISQYTHTPKDI